MFFVCGPLLASALLLGPHATSPVRPAAHAARRASTPCAAAASGDEGAGDDGFSQDFYSELRKRGGGVVEPDADAPTDGAAPDDETDTFTNDLYAHLGQRPEYATKEFYKGLRARVDVEDPMMDELSRRRELLANTTQPSPSQGPNEVIELVLRALQDVDYPFPGHGIEVLMNYTGPGSSINPSQSRVTAEMLLKYFESSKYRILMQWRNIQYLRKLDVSMDKKRAFQPVKLKDVDGAWIPVTFQLSKYPTALGDIWLIDQFLVKTAERRGEQAPGDVYE